jgi:para-nitrobenzyl esterase
MVWLHGGGFRHGSGSWFVYAGDRLARRGDVVVVCINYRLGVLGSLDLRGFGHPTSTETNVGLRDQLAALAWVRDNIDAFGGDPQNVTLFGQSAGAMSIGALLASRAARGLYHRAILQSGALRNLHSPEQAHGVAARLLEELGIDPECHDLDARLRALPVEALLHAQGRVSAGHRLPLGMLAWQPVIDDTLIERDPLRKIEAAEEPGVPVLIGTNRDEWKMFTATDRKRRNLDWTALRGYLERTLKGVSPDHQAATAEALQIYTEALRNGRTRSAGELWVAFQTDRVFRVPALQLADVCARRGDPTFFYRFDWAPRVVRDRVGACHSLEIPFVFGTLREPLLRPVLGLQPSALALSDRMQAAWIAFARTGHPGHDGLPGWPAYRPGEGAAMVFGTTSRLEAAMPAAKRIFWQGRHF